MVGAFPVLCSNIFQLYVQISWRVQLRVVKVLSDLETISHKYQSYSNCEVHY